MGRFIMKVASIFPENAIESDSGRADVIVPSQFGSIPELFEERVRRSATHTAYVQFDPDSGAWVDYSWGQMNEFRNQWRNALMMEGFEAGERVALRLKNCIQWVLFDQASLSVGLVVVPIYMEDRADNISYILEHTETRLLLVESYDQWLEMVDEQGSLSLLQRVVVVGEDERIESAGDDRVVWLNRWLDCDQATVVVGAQLNADDLATIVYTSGTTGKPKGVMLTHNNMLANACGGLQSMLVYPTDRFLSFLPLSHMFERTVGYYLTMMAGASVAYNRSVPELLDDLAEIRPTAITSVPRIFERAHAKIKTGLDEGSQVKKWLFEQAVETGWQRFEMNQGREKWSLRQLFWPILNRLVAGKVAARFGGRLRLVASGGARLSPKIAKVFVGLGINIFQGYGLTETSPILTTNTLSRNKPWTVGLPLMGAEIRLSEEGELQARGPYIMSGYWKNPDATAGIIDQDGWLKTGDIASIDDQGFISITGRIKEIIVLANGEKVPPADIESAISDNPLFEQVMVVGEGRPWLTAVVVLNESLWEKQAQQLGVDPADPQSLCDAGVTQYVSDQITGLLRGFPGYVFIRYVTLSITPWTVENNSITPTLKLKRSVLASRFEAEIEEMYAGGEN